MNAHLPRLALCLFALPAFAHWAALRPVPLDLMLKDATERLAAAPENAEAVYLLGRVHYLAFDLGVAASPTFQPDSPAEGLPSRELIPDRRQVATWEARTLTPEERRQHAEQALPRLRKARELDAGSALYALTLGSFEKAWLESDLRASVTNGPLAALTVSDAMGQFQAAWELGRKADLKLKHLPLTGRMGIVSGEAIRAWMSLADAHGLGDPALREKMAKDLAKLDALRMGAITPLLFHPLADKDDPVPVRSGASVAFDLLGDGSGGRWSWPEAGAALLVWDPGQNGTVQSGADLFGGYTWQMPWRDGFEALRVLDRNRDGRIDGAELSGISAWFDDENSGHVDVGEVPTLGQLGVAAILLDAVAFEGDAALVWHPAGIRFADGKSVPLWDWLAQPAP